MSIFELGGYTIFVTGAGGLLGREHCQAIIDAGGRVVAIDSDKSRLESLKELFNPKDLIPAHIDIRERHSVGELLGQISESSDRLGLVNNAAINHSPSEPTFSTGQTRLESYNLEQWNLEISVGLTGALIMTQVIGSEMARRQFGVIVNVSSDLGVVAPDQWLYGGPDSEWVKPVTYSVIKHGIIGLTRYCSTYWAHAGIRANALSPGGVQSGQPADFVSEVEKRIPMRRMARADDYRGALVFLLSDASSYMNGGNLIIDGGRTSW